MNRLKQKYQKEIIPALIKEFKVKNLMAVPKILKVVINIGIGEISSNKALIEKAESYLAAITGQKPLRRGAKKAIADFKTRRGDIIGLKVTLRKEKMYQFIDKLATLVLPRVRDFSGLSKKAFDKQANYTLGLKEQTIFPEVDYDKIDKVRGLEISFVTSTESKKQALRLLELLGIAFEKRKNG